jgi:hypothetical protein
MIDLIRRSAVPSHIMRAASRGALSLPPAEILEILVSLTENPVFGEQAKLTLAGWDEQACREALSALDTPPEVLEYFVAPQNCRVPLLSPLIENPSLPESHLLDMARSRSRECLLILKCSARVRQLPQVLAELADNPELSAEEAAEVRSWLPASQPLPVEAEDTEDMEFFRNYLEDHAAEIALEEDKPYVLMGASSEEEAELATSKAGSPVGAAAEEKAIERLSVIQKIARLTVGQRVVLSFRGNKDERFLLIRDGSRVVSSAVLDSPKVSDVEIEQYASMRSLQEHIFRGISLKRKFMKNYNIVRALTSNPHCPLDVSLPLVKHLTQKDLGNLVKNKDVADAVRKMAFKLFRQRAEGAKKDV